MQRRGGLGSEAQQSGKRGAQDGLHNNGSRELTQKDSVFGFVSNAVWYLKVISQVRLGYAGYAVQPVRWLMSKIIDHCFVELKSLSFLK